MKLALWHWHIEISSRCTLKCPRCARTEVPDTLVQTELDLDFFKRNFTPSFILEHVEKITFCGDDGDPIYAPDLIPVIAYFKSVKSVKIVIVTNGSYKPTKWWESLGAVLDANDHIYFSLDGWNQESNEKYRVNSNWESITSGVSTIRSTSQVYMTWAAIAFSFNQDKIDFMKSMAQTLGFDQFQLTLSTKFNRIYSSSYPENDHLQPRDELTSSSLRFERVLTKFNDRADSEVGTTQITERFGRSIAINNVVPLCQIGTIGLFINSRGNFFPCCFKFVRW